MIWCLLLQQTFSPLKGRKNTKIQNKTKNKGTPLRKATKGEKKGGIGLRAEYLCKAKKQLAPTQPSVAGAIGRTYTRICRRHDLHPRRQPNSQSCSHCGYLLEQANYASATVQKTSKKLQKRRERGYSKMGCKESLRPKEATLVVHCAFCGKANVTFYGSIKEAYKALEVALAQPVLE